MDLSSIISLFSSDCKKKMKIFQSFFEKQEERAVRFLFVFFCNFPYESSNICDIMSQIQKKVTREGPAVKTKHRVLALGLAVLMALSAAGCVYAGVEDLYSLPRMSEEYLQLEALIAQRIDEGGEYAAPVGGNNRQSVQLQDLDGDGVAEAIAFLADENHMPTVCIYRRSGDGDYYLYVVIDGEGSAVSSVEYADITGDGAREIILCWQIGGDIHLLSACTMKGEEPVEILSADCSKILVEDLDGDGVEEILNLRLDYSGTSTLLCYEFGPDNTIQSSESPLSAGITEVKRARMGLLSDGSPALFVESLTWAESLVTDVFRLAGGQLQNITMAASGASNTARTNPAYAADINGDRAMEIPESAGDILNWYSLDSAGRKTLALTTYHDYESDWYLILPETYWTGLTVTRRTEAAGETAVTFGVDGEDVLRIYTLTGENRRDRAEAEGRFLLRSGETTVYAAELLRDDLTQEDVLNNFNLIYSEWQTGDL